MGEGEPVKVAVAEEKAEQPPRAPVTSELVVLEEKAVVTPEEEKPEKETETPEVEKIPDASAERDAVLTKLQTEKRLSLVKAWEENEKTKADSKAIKKLASLVSLENAKKASLEAELKKMEEELEKKKAECAEKMKNKIAMVHKQTEEKKAQVEAKRCEEILKAEEMAAKYCATGITPKKLFSWLGA